MFEVLRDETDIAWLNAIEMEELVEIATADADGVIATIAGGAIAIAAPVVNWDWNEDVRAIPAEDTTFEAICTLYEVYAARVAAGVNVAT
jgi:hypothetical protein